ncbi:CPBP family intramembrane metalloprotease [Cytobacillus spongiae]|jgi:membrane protease YdiL (CAAX protease family)|uniref:CPBP family intramembrane glutamic endopeptidase n=1 Tax=Cytobacillus spongiae TaxID=2901381 RepID=UPI001F39340C|nr:CPBP family intramembrane glutamic endopeptidase [Cytobacillus spongiae]UII54133.1 CPBP family intramembrane metalloprotease [Cytobacillus spongiae]
MNDTQQTHLNAFWLITFTIIFLAFELQSFQIAYLLLFITMLVIPFLHEELRVFSWAMIAFFVGKVIYLYSHRMVASISLDNEEALIISRILILIPILAMAYVIRKFKRPIVFYWQKPEWNQSIRFPFIWSGLKPITIRQFLIIAIGINIILFLPLLREPKMVYSFSFILMFTLIHAFIEEFLWRGVILSRMVELVGGKKALVFSSVAFGLSHLSLGYSLAACLAFAFTGIFFAGITLRSKSLLPAIIWHGVLNILMLSSGFI